MTNELLNNPYFEYLVSPVIVISFIAYMFHISFKLGENKNKFERVISDIDELKSNVNELLKGFTEMRNDFSVMQNDFSVVKTHLVSNTGLDSHLFLKKSPLTLTDKGEMLVAESGFKKKYENNKSWYLNEIKKYNPKTLADIDEASLKILEAENKKDKNHPYKEISFQNGITVDVLIKALSIYLRNKAAKEFLL